MSARLQPEQRQSRQPGSEREMRPQPDYEPKYPGVGKLEDRVALITGGDSGIGRATAVAMAREGAKIAIVYLEEDQDADETVRLVEREGSRAIKIAGDVARKSSARRRSSEPSKSSLGSISLSTTPRSSTRPKIRSRSMPRSWNAPFAPICSDFSSW
jgi:hypothetical protein